MIQVRGAGRPATQTYQDTAEEPGGTRNEADGLFYAVQLMKNVAWIVTLIFFSMVDVSYEP